MTHSESCSSNGSQDSSDGFGKAIADLISKILFIGFITALKCIGCYIYIVAIMILVSLLSLGAIIIGGMLVGAVLGKTLGILAGVVLFGAILMGPFAGWMQRIKAAAKREFFGTNSDKA